MYVGQSVRLMKRRAYYRRLECKNQVKIYRSIKKYGWSKHKFEILCLCKEEELDELEIYYGNLYDCTNPNTGLNIRCVGGNKGSLNDETKLKISSSNKGRVVSTETKEKIRKTLLGNIPWNKGKKMNKPAWNKGITHPEHIKQYYRELYTGKTGIDSTSARPLVQYNMDGTPFKVWCGAREAGRITGYTWSVINRAARGERKHAYGFKWTYL